ncbi:MAG TPA: iron dependent repressor, metal binding and dimerization domain protein [Candidatus Polarisedimenticolaceae bacterium]
MLSVIDPRVALLTFVLVAVVIVLLLWPRRGGPTRARSPRRSEQVLIEDALKHLFHATADGQPAHADTLAGALEIRRERALEILTRLQDRALARAEGAGVVLTEEGRAYALRIVRSHRLLERYLADRTGVEPEEWHALADAREHELSREEVEALAARMGHPRFDPHGDPIPTADGELPPSRGVALSALAPGDGGRVVHLEDEPPEAFERLRSAGLHVGSLVRLRESTPSTVRVEIEGRVTELARVLAPAITVFPTTELEAPGVRTLAGLAAGRSGRVRRLSPACQGAQRRRLLDLGIVPGTSIRAEFASLGGDPVAYRVRGALIALRRAQAEWIELDPVETASEAVSS